jgi:hypothetical protein
MASPGDRGSRTRAWALVALFLATAGVVTLSLRRSLPGGGAEELVDAKLERFEEIRDECTVLFLGSSRVHRGFVPEVFDRAMAERGLATRSFNFGAPGSRAFEVRHVLERVVELEPRSVAFVFVDPEGIAVLRDERNHLARQVIDWHDPEATLLLSRFIADMEMPPRAKLDALLPHWQSCAYNLANIGRSQRWIDASLGTLRTPERLKNMLGAGLDGYAPLGVEGEELSRRGERFQKKRRDAYLAELEAFKSLEIREGPPSEFALKLYGDIVERVEALGATPIFVTQPALYLQDDLIRAAERGEVRQLVRFDSPVRFPELYDPDHRYDATHLNDEGARIFTEMLAREFAARIERGELRAR